MQRTEHLLSGQCDMQLVGLKNTYFPVRYELVLCEDDAQSDRNAVSSICSIECIGVGGMPAGTYILTDVPNLMLSNFTGEWTFTTTA